MKTIVINGANGYVASNFISTLLKQEYRVIAMVRANKKHSPEERMKYVLSEINDGENSNTENLKVYSYSLLDENFNISVNELENIFGEDIEYFHFAASLKFDEKSKDEIFATNVDGLENSINVFSKYATKSSRFFYIGTAYSCGKFSGVFEEKFYDNEDISAFRNYYEQSKRFAENVLKSYTENNELNGYIIRLSQVVGNNKSWVTKTDYGIFDFTKRMHSLANRYSNNKVRVHVDPAATQNLIPVDTVVSYLMKTIETEQLPKIMNFIASNSVKNGHIIEGLNKLLPIHIVPLKEINHKDMNAIERLISVGMSFTGSYIDTNILFDTKKRDKIIKPSAEYEVTERSVFKMLEYSIENFTSKKEKQKLVAV